MKKKKKKITAIVHQPRKINREITMQDVGMLILHDAEDRIQKQVQNVITNIAEHVLSRIRHFESQIEKDKFWLAEFERKKQALANGEFTADKFTGSVTFHDDTLNHLG